MMGSCRVRRGHRLLSSAFIDSFSRRILAWRPPTRSPPSTASPLLDASRAAAPAAALSLLKSPFL
jgi:hypothetical protein